MLPTVYAYLPELLKKLDGHEQCFEQAKGSAWLLVHYQNPDNQPNTKISFPLSDEIFSSQTFQYTEGDLTRLLQVPGRELPLEAFMLRRYAQRLMEERQEMSVDWGDPFTSAELYVQQVCREKNNNNTKSLNDAVQTEAEIRLSLSPIYQEDIFVNRRREGMCFKVPPLRASDSPRDVSWPSKRQSLETPTIPSTSSAVNPRISTIAALPGEQRRELAVGDSTPLLLRRKDCHLIDVSNFFGEEREEAMGVEEASPQAIATQLFSPRQVWDILKQTQGGVSYEKTKMETSMSEHGTDAGVNPWSSKFTNVFWAKVATRMTNWSNYFVRESEKPPKKNFEFGHQTYGVEKLLGAGTFGKVYLVRLTTMLEPGRGMGDSDQMNATVVSPELAASVGHSRTGIARIVKLQCPDYPLEFYHMREVRRRLTTAFTTGKTIMDVRPSICPALALTYSPSNFSCLLMPYYPVGLLEWINYDIQASNSRRSGYTHSSSTRKIDPLPKLDKFEDELVMLYLTLELLWLVDGLHKYAGIIHGDIKPDNFRLNDRFPLLDVSAFDIDQENSPGRVADFSCCLMSGRSTKVLVLIDFGMCIDMARFPKDTIFKVEKAYLAKRSFPCIEMLTGRPWTYQLDLFNIAGVIYTLVFKKYMKVKCVKNVWQPEFLPHSSRTYRAKDVWRSIILSLVNIKSCLPEDYPDLSVLRRECEAFLVKHANEYNTAAEKANHILSILTSNQ